jgi:hypothetical protein
LNCVDCCSIHLDCEKELAQRDQLYQKRMKIEAAVRQFQNNNEEYTKIKKTVEEKVHSILLDRRMVLKLALLSLIESMGKDQDKFSSLIYHNRSSTTQSENFSQYYFAGSYGQQPYPSQDYPIEAYTAMLLEAAEKLYDKLAKELGDGSISDYAFRRSSSLPVLSPSDEKEQQSHPKQTTTANQTDIHTEELRLTQSEVDDD